MKNKILSFLLKSILFFICGIMVQSCSTEYCKDKAVDRARDYIFECYPKMSPQNANYIKYTYPKFLTSRISSTVGALDPSEYYWEMGNNYFAKPKFSKSKEFSQLAIAWDLPSPNVTIMVLGTCCDDYWDWAPLKLLIKEQTANSAFQANSLDQNTKETPEKPLDSNTPTVH